MGGRERESRRNQRYTACAGSQVGTTSGHMLRWTSLKNDVINGHLAVPSTEVDCKTPDFAIEKAFSFTDRWPHATSTESLHIFVILNA